MQGIIASKTQENKEFNLLVISTVEIIKVNGSVCIWQAAHTDFTDTVNIFDKKVKATVIFSHVPRCREIIMFSSQDIGMFSNILFTVITHGWPNLTNLVASFSLHKK